MHLMPKSLHSNSYCSKFIPWTVCYFYSFRETLLAKKVLHHDIILAAGKIIFFSYLSKIKKHFFLALVEMNNVINNLFSLSVTNISLAYNFPFSMVVFGCIFSRW